MSLNFVLGHIPGRANATADYLSRLQLDPSEKYKLRMNETIPLHEILALTSKGQCSCLIPKYRSFYDRKAMAQPLNLHGYCLLLDPRLTGQDMFVKKNMTKWIPLFRVETVLTNMNYIVRKTGTNYTQCVHRIRLRPIVPQFPVEDLEVIDTDKFLTDPVLQQIQSEPEIFDMCLPELLCDRLPEVTGPRVEVWGTAFLFFGGGPPAITKSTSPTSRTRDNWRRLSENATDCTKTGTGLSDATIPQREPDILSYGPINSSSDTKSANYPRSASFQNTPSN
jgi:hypothetical protein